jgi:hypothetical protein
MPRIITIRCNGSGSHENEIDIDKLFTPCFVVRPDAPIPGMERRRVLDCARCREGKVVVTPEMIREATKTSIPAAEKAGPTETK